MIFLWGPIVLLANRYNYLFTPIFNDPSSYLHWPRSSVNFGVNTLTPILNKEEYCPFGPAALCPLGKFTPWWGIVTCLQWLTCRYKWRIQSCKDLTELLVKVLCSTLRQTLLDHLAYTSLRWASVPNQSVKIATVVNGTGFFNSFTHNLWTFLRSMARRRLRN